MAIVVCEQDQSVGMVAKKLRGLKINKHDKSAFAKMAPDCRGIFSNLLWNISAM